MCEPVFQAALRERMWKIEGIHAEAKHRHNLKRAKYRGISLAFLFKLLGLFPIY